MRTSTFPHRRFIDVLARALVELAANDTAVHTRLVQSLID
jgi:hypothetical protein